MEEEGDGEDGILPVASDIPLLQCIACLHKSRTRLQEVHASQGLYVTANGVRNGLVKAPTPTTVPNHLEKEGALPFKKKEKK